ncbi:MAG: LON peptidase substrate-binding domain-containing protein [Candidatus Nanopelagicales bacterium]
MTDGRVPPPERRRIPLFPLGTVLVPGLVLPLHIFEPRYRRMVADLQELPEDERAFGVVAIRQGREVGADTPSIHEVGTIASIREITPLGDGRFELVTVGTDRFRIVGVRDDKPYLHADVEDLPEDSGGSPEAVAHAVTDSFVEYRSMFADDDTELPDDPRVLSYLVAAAVVTDLPSRQEFLEAASDVARLRAELAFLRRETAIISALPSLPAVDMMSEEPSPN